jgi:ABC-2 type transport system permease protein
MSFYQAFKEIFLFYLKRGVKAKKSKLFFLISMIPVVILFIAKLIEIINPDSQVSAADIFSKVFLVVYIQLLLPILALFYGSSTINEEVDSKTMVFLTTCPVPKSAIVLGKYVAYGLLSLIIINLGFILSFLIINVTRLNQMVYLSEFFTFFGVGILAFFSYSALFLLLGTLFKKSMILGLLFIFGWESVVQYFPGTTQKFTLIHYVKSLLPYSTENVKFLVFRLEPSPLLESFIVLVLVTLVSLVMACLIFNRKEYVLADMNG